MSVEKIYEKISKSITDLDEEKALELARTAIEKNFNLLEIIEKGYGKGIQKIGDLWEEGEYFLPELMLGGKIVQKVLEILIPHLEDKNKKLSAGKIVIATIKGDIHSIGKTIVGTMLSANGFEVFDLGADVPAEVIVEEAIKRDADIIGVSALLTTTMVGQKEVINKLKEKGLRDKFKVILGGAPVNQSWVENADADGYADNANEAVKLVKSLIGKKK
ncbi:MAG: corrinoid protein [Candidatus Lokiarchaeota archaeon]